MGPVGITFAILLFLTIIISGSYYTCIYSVKLLGVVIHYFGKFLYFISASIVLCTSVIVILTVTYLAVAEIIKAWKPRTRYGSIASRIFQEADCVICKESETEVLYVPCLHLCTCRNCADMMGNDNRKCPICRNSIKERFVRVKEDMSVDLDASFHLF